jgi:hypothetical protein
MKGGDVLVLISNLQNGALRSVLEVGGKVQRLMFDFRWMTKFLYLLVNVALVDPSFGFTNQLALCLRYPMKHLSVSEWKMKSILEETLM